MHQRRKIKTGLGLILSFILCMCFCSCGKNSLSEIERFRKNNGEFSVHFLDVGQGDCTLIHFPDGKTVLLDTGRNTDVSTSFVNQFLSKFNVKKIDYLILSHPDNDHIGGTLSILDNFDVGLIYLPNVLQPQFFELYNQILQRIQQKNLKTKVFKTYHTIIGDNYSLAFLTPIPFDFPQGTTPNINTKYPTETDINDASPIIYLNYLGVRFILTADAGISQENYIVENKSALITTFKSMQVDLNFDYVDYLKVAGHGSSQSNGQNFLSLIKPKNAIISVGGANSYGYPNTAVLSRLITANPTHNLFRTDVFGTISVYVSSSGAITTITDKI